MSIGRWKSIALNVTDMDVAAEFWSEVLGWERRPNWTGWLGYLKDPDSPNYMILIETHKAPIETVDPSHHETNRLHIDIWPNEGMDTAVADIVAIGGRVKKPPSLYPRPGTHGDEPPAIDWAVMQDPFGNEFCIVEHLSLEQVEAALAADTADDQQLRVAAGVSAL